jgi:hypothetical protein
MMNSLFPVKAGILKNTKKGTFHPILFRASPRPSDDCLQHCRYKSAGHHTHGVTPLEHAREFLAEQKQKDTGLVWEWDGEDVPAMIMDFGITPPIAAEQERN